MAIEEGDTVFILEKSNEDDWWKAKKRAENDEEEEPVGLIPNNYVDEVSIKSRVPSLHFRCNLFAPSQSKCRAKTGTGIGTTDPSSKSAL